MKSLEETTFAIIGLGLIGGSYAKALKNRNAHKIIGMDRNHIVSLMAKDEGYITDIADEDPSLCRERISSSAPCIPELLFLLSRTM
ncbi:hypothetical protein M5E89_02075 [Acidaminococcus intestini]|nr:hypothetical protein M5E89_02075 [Acidaminococcus intestini]